MPKKSLGQNFLIDHNIARKIISIISKHKKCNIIEIGPGKGFLTDYLIKCDYKRILLIEKDRFLFSNLKKKYNLKNIKLVNEDVLITKEISKISKPKIIVSNLPYNISTKVIIQYLSKINEYEGLYFMVQKEVAERLKFKNNKKSNRLNLIANLMSNYEKVFDISPNVFRPRPKVISSFISFQENIKYKIDTESFQEFTKILFSTKRKKILNNLNRKFKDKLLLYNNSIKNIDLNKRPEALSLKEVVYLFNELN